MPLSTFDPVDRDVMNDAEFDLPGDPPGDEPEYEWLDEWLCEYVDGTMDPALETVFEEYVEANPDLKAHVESLQETRKLLCESSELIEASRKAQARVCSRVECEMLRSQPSLSDTLSGRPSAAVGVASSIVVALVVGFFAGAVFFSPEGAHVSLSPSASASAAPAGNAPGPRPAPLSLTQTATDRPRTSPVDLRPFVRSSFPPRPAADTARSVLPLSPLPPSTSARTP
jgi:hypothetical protein